MASLKDFENKVKEHINMQEWSEAYKIANQILTLDPENNVFLRYKYKIEKEVKKIWEIRLMLMIIVLQVTIILR